MFRSTAVELLRAGWNFELTFDTLAHMFNRLTASKQLDLVELKTDTGLRTSLTRRPKWQHPRGLEVC